MSALRKSLRWLLLIVVFSGCIENPQQPPPGEESGSAFRIWTIERLANDPEFDRLVEANQQEGGVVDVVRVIGGLSIYPGGAGPEATGEVFSNETGETYWVSAQAPAPNGLEAPDSAVGTETKLNQVLRFRKDTEDAELRFTITQVQLEAIEGNAADPTNAECPWWVRGVLTEFAGECAPLMKAEVQATYFAYTDPTRLEPPEAFYFATSTAKLYGWGTSWIPDVYTDGPSVQPLFRRGHFNTDVDSDGSGRHPILRLQAPVPVEIPLDSVDVGEEFEVVMMTSARSHNRRQKESYVAAYFRDPATSNGLTVEFEGLAMLDPPDEIREDVVWTPPAVNACETPGAGGTIAFETGSYLEPEWPAGGATITVTRTGGSAGTASVVFTTSDGTAVAGSDYNAVTSLILFADGEDGKRAVRVPIITDTEQEDDETVMLSLASPGGCATLGAAAAQLTILDDDQPPPASYTLGGTVVGLEGTGLRVRDRGIAVTEITENGAWAFNADYVPGSEYDVTIDAQPSDPLQVCTVTNGTGVFGDEDVTDVLVTCETPAATGGLDPAFGTGGIVEANIAPDTDDRFAMALATQPDGKVLAVGQTTVVRYNADGTVDTSFGTNGQVVANFGTGGERLYAVAVQPDGRILIAGAREDNVGLPANDDFAMMRLEADGTLDASFGTGGVVTTDFHGRIDAAYDVLVQPDGAIVLAGVALDAAVNADFAVARYTSAGVLDTSFGPAADGKAAINLAGNSDNAYSVALQSDGGIIVAGRAAASGGSDPDIGIVRFDASGILDANFGDAGIVRAPTAEAEWALDVVVDVSGRILVSGGVGGTGFVARYGADGAPDASFDGGMITTDLLFSANGIALDDEGRILIAGAGADDLAVVRVLDTGAIDTDFGTNGDGRVTADFYGSGDEASDVVVQSDGRIVIGGVIRSGLQRYVGLARVLP